MPGVLEHLQDTLNTKPDTIPKQMHEHLTYAIWALQKGWGEEGRQTSVALTELRDTLTSKCPDCFRSENAAAAGDLEA